MVYVFLLIHIWFLMKYFDTFMSVLKFFSPHTLYELLHCKFKFAIKVCDFNLTAAQRDLLNVERYIPKFQHYTYTFQEQNRS